MSYEYNELTEHIIHCHCHKVVTSNLNVFNKFFLKDSFRVGLLFKLQQEKPGFVTLFLWVQLSALWDQCDASNSNSRICELMSYKSRTRWEERKQKTTASWTRYIKSRKAALHFAVRAHLAPQTSVKTSTAKPTSRRHFLHRGDQHLRNAEDCSWEMTRSYLTKSFWVLPESTSSAKPNWRGKRTTPAEEKGYCLRANLEVTLCLTRCQESTRQVRTGGFPGGQRTLFAVQEASCSSTRQSRLPAPQTLTAAPEPEQKWASPGENVTALAGEDLVWRLIWVNCKGLFLCVHVRVCARAGVRINWVRCQGLIFNDASLL